MLETIDQLRAKYRYLPADKLMQSFGYEHHHLGRYHRRVAGGMQVVSVFSESGSFVLQLSGQTLVAEVVNDDEQLLRFLKANGFA